MIRVLHKVYKYTLSPLIGQECRFYPTCSDYALEAVEKLGWWKGGLLAAKRICKCGPWCDGGVDLVEGGLLKRTK